MKEEFKFIPGYEGKYIVSNLGYVIRLPHIFIDRANRKFNLNKRIQPMKKVSSGYITVTYGNGSDANWDYMHRLVAKLFIENSEPEIRIDVNHKDGNKQNNVYTNLEWVTKSENMQHASKNGLLNNSSEKRKKQAPINARRGAYKSYKKCVEYDLDGNLIKIHDSQSNVGDGKRYSPDRFRHKNSVWRDYEILIEKYGYIPDKIQLDKSIFEKYNSPKLIYKLNKYKDIINIYDGYKNLPLDKGKVIFCYNHQCTDKDGNYWVIKNK